MRKTGIMATIAIVVMSFVSCAADDPDVLANRVDGGTGGDAADVLAEDWEYASGPPVFVGDALWVGGGVLHEASGASQAEWIPVGAVGRFTSTGELLEMITVQPPDGHYWGNLQVTASGRHAVAAICPLGWSEVVGCSSNADVALINLETESFDRVTSGQGDPVRAMNGALSVLHESEGRVLLAVTAAAGTRLGESDVAVLRVGPAGDAEPVAEVTGSNVGWICSPDGESITVATRGDDEAGRPQEVVVTTTVGDSSRTRVVRGLDPGVGGGRIHCLDDGSVVVLLHGSRAQAAWLAAEADAVDVRSTAHEDLSQWGLPMPVDDTTVMLAAYPSVATSAVTVLELSAENELRIVAGPEASTPGAALIYDTTDQAVRDASAAVSVPPDQWEPDTTFPVLAVHQ